MRKFLHGIIAALFISGIASGSYVIPDHGVTGIKVNSNAVDNSTLQYSGNQLSVKALGVGTSQIAAAAVTRAKLDAVGQLSSSSSFSFTTSSASFVDVTNLSLSVATGGRPVIVMIQSDGLGQPSQFCSSGTSTSTVRVLRDAVEVARYTVGIGSGSTPCVLTAQVALDAPSAGAHVYKVQGVSNSVLTFSNAVLVVYEL